MLKLIKLSHPGWEIECDDYREVLEYLQKHLCYGCTNEAMVWAMLGTACGAEFMLEEEPDG